MRSAALALAALVLTASAPVSQPPSPGPASMRAFTSDKDMLAFLRRIAARRRALPPPIVMAVPAPAAPPIVTLAAPATDAIVVTGARADGITNTQEADVDEGGIVKVAGEHLVILRRGRLFTISLADNAMRPVDRIDAFPPGSAKDENAWYDEMLISGDRVIVIGYSYGRGGTEINRFRIAPNGGLRFEDSYHLRSDDYYSSSNYASRLIGNTLIFYAPLDLDPQRPLAALPGLRRWTGDPKAPFARTLPATRLYLPEPVRREPSAGPSTLHSVTQCELTTAPMRCRATAVLGSSSRSFYVSGEAVYVWTDGDRPRRAGSGAFVYRLPLDGSAPGAVQAWGGPVDQFSFAEDQAEGKLRVVVRADSEGDAMWHPERSEGDAALLTMPIAAFGDGRRVMPRAAYRSLPVDGRDSWSFHNRFVGRHLIYAAGRFNEHMATMPIHAVPLNGDPIVRIPVPHGVDRLDLIGTDAIAIGNDRRERLGFSALELNGTARLGDTYFLPAAHEGERRSQAFFFRPDADSPDGASGMLGLPVSRDLGDTPAARFLGSGSAVAFLRRDARRFSPAGELVANNARARDDGCTASCVDWYGNARPIFLNGRVFALMGYELVEGRIAGGLIGERARIDFAPTAAPRRN